MARYATYAPEFRLEIGGEPVPAELRGAITRISHTDGIAGADRVEVTLADDRLRWVDHPLLTVDAPFALSLGYAPDPLERVFVGEVTGLSPAFPAGGMPTVTVVAHDFLQRLTVGSRDRGFLLDIPTVGHFPMPDPAIAALVAGSNLLIPRLDPVGSALSFLVLLLSFATDRLEAKKGVRTQSGSDFDFLTGIAKENGWEMSIEHAEEPQGFHLRFRFLMQDYRPEVALGWGSSLIDFTPRLTTVGQVAGIQTRIWVSSIKTEFVVVLGWDVDRAAFDLQIFPGFQEVADVVGGTRARSLRKVKSTGALAIVKLLLSDLLPRLNSRLTGAGTAVGNLALKSGRVIDLTGLGERFSGLYRLTSVTHTIDGSGFRTAFAARQEVWFGAIPRPRGLAGLARVNGQGVG